MVWTKICGLRDVAAARAIAPLRPAAIGLNFYQQSVRCVTTEAATEIVRGLPHDIEPVGVFVNERVERIAALVEQVGLRRIQLHGDETPDDVARLHERCPQTPLIRAWRMSPQGLGNLGDYLRDCESRGITLSACLVDAHVAGAYGGTGVVVPWEQLRAQYRINEWPPLILAGGLHPGNVGAAMAAVQPWGVDVASGVESSPGVKDLALVEEFLTAARQRLRGNSASDC